MHNIVAVRGEGEVLRNVPLSALGKLLDDPKAAVWVDIAGPLDIADERIFWEFFHFHETALDDCFEAREHPKVEAFDGYVYVITHGLLSGSTAEDAEAIELDAFLGKRYLVTYHEQPSRSVASVREAVLRDGGPLRQGPTLLFHSILDVQVDTIEEVLDATETLLEEMETRVFVNPHAFDLEGLLAVKRTTLKLRRWMSKQREVMLRLSRKEFGLIGPNEAALFRDLFDHISRFVDLIESFREMAISILDVYLAVSNTKLNETMKFLTLFTAVLMPLTVITGIYGMNFEYMPELRSRFGYPLVLVSMVITPVLIVRFFKRRGWFGHETPPLAAPTPVPAPRTEATRETVLPSLSRKTVRHRRASQA